MLSLQQSKYLEKIILEISDCETARFYRKKIFIIDIKYFNIRRKIGLAKIDILLVTIRRNRIEMVYNDYKPCD